MNTDVLPKVALIAGPTASGKSALALELAEARNGVVINADSAQVYRDLRILTARPSAAEEARAPNRLFGHIDAADAHYSAARWAAEAREAIGAAVAARQLPIVVGGTGLYIRTLLDGIAPVPPIDPAIRAAVRALPVAQAHAALTIEDPQAAARLAPADTTRVARALEVIRSTGQPLSHWQTQRSGGIAAAVDLRPLVLLPDRATLFARIDARLEAMLVDNALAEVAALHARTDVPPDAPIRRAIGVLPFSRHLVGVLSLDEALAQAQQQTRRYAKRQFTWLRHQLPATWPRTDGFSNNIAHIAID